MYEKLNNISKKDLSFNVIKNYIKTSCKAKIKLGNSPDFLILGAQKAGTTSLINYIREYSDNFLFPTQKETKFFTEKTERGISWYKAYFPIIKKEGYITGEATPDYLFYHKAPERIVQFLPKIKFVVLLRNPVDRAYSQYNFQNFNSKNAYNPLPFKKAIQQDIMRFKNNYYLKNDEFNFIYKYFSYVSRGIYSIQIKQWFNYFPKERFLFIYSNNLFNNTEKVLKDVFDFLDLRFKDQCDLNFKKYNKSTYDNMSFETRNFLSNFYESYNKELSNLIDKPLPLNW